MNLYGMERFKAWIFDLDGTLVDSAPDILHLLHETMTEAGLDTSRLDTSKIGPLLEDIVKDLCPALDVAARDALIAKYRARYLASSFRHSHVYAGIVPLCNTLLASTCRLFVATNKPHDVTRALLDAKGLLPLFSDISCSNSMRGRTLSKQEMIERLLALHNLDTGSTVMVGDSYLDMQGGRSAGIATAAALYGYGEKSALLACAPSFTIADAAWTHIVLCS